MPRNGKRTKIAKLRASLHNGKPLAIDVRALGAIEEALGSGDLEAMRAALSFGEDRESTASSVKGVAVIPITGVLRDQEDFMVRWGGCSCYQHIEREFREAMANTDVKGVLFYCDSPGGSAIGVKRVADMVKAATGDKPIHAYVQGLCASACYYIAAACDAIHATADSLVGSIGTIMPHVEGKKMFDELGIKYTVFTNKDSPKKGHGNSYEHLTPESRATLQSFVNSYGGPFIEDVARYRETTAQEVIAKFGQGDAMRADIAIRSGMIDSVVANFSEALDKVLAGASSTADDEPPQDETPVVSGKTTERSNAMNERIKAQLFALGLIDSMTASDAECKAALNGFYRGKLPADEAAILNGLQSSNVNAEEADAEDEDDEEDTEMEDRTPPRKPKNKPAKPQPQSQVNTERFEARMDDLSAFADTINEQLGYAAITSDMVLAAVRSDNSVAAEIKAWNKALAEKEPPVATGRVKVTGEGADRYASDVVDALVFRASDSRDMQLSDSAAEHVGKPLWAIAAESLQLAGHKIDIYAEPSFIAEQAMEMGTPGKRHTFFSEREHRQYMPGGRPVQAAGPYNRPGDFPNILSNLANKYLDTIELDEDYSYPAISAMIPGGLKDFKPATMMNKGVVEELDELTDADQFKELGIAEEVLSYIFLRRFGNKFGWTPVMIANDDLGAFVEGMIGLSQAWEVTQNRLVLDIFTSNPTLLDGSALFANRTDVGGAANNNLRSSGNPPSDTEWEAMEVLYADIGGVNTQKRVRGMLNTILCPTGSVFHDAQRYFSPYPILGEEKIATATTSVGIYRGKVNIVPDSELRNSSTIKWWGLRSPNRLNTATVVRGYFNGFGTMGRRERWYDPETKTTYVSLEGRIGVAAKNWRYAVQNAGTGA